MQKSGETPEWSWFETMLNVHVFRNDFDGCVSVIQEMGTHGVQPVRATYNLLIKSVTTHTGGGG